MKWAEHVAFMGEETNAYTLPVEKPDMTISTYE
jgi:hypothetical protein